MKLNYCGSFLRVLAIGLMAGGLSFASIVPTYEAAGVQTPDVTAICAANPGPGNCVIGMENFDSLALAGQAIITGFSTSFNTSGAITGTYSSFIGTPANAYGGAGGSGTYAEIYGTDNTGYLFYSNNTYTLSLTANTVPGVNYLGMWFSALDGGSHLKFYSGGPTGTLLYDFTPADFIALVGSCPNTSNTFCDNPNAGGDPNQQFAFLNFFDNSGYFDTVTFTESAGFGGGFESDNQTVAYLNPGNPHGDPINGTPEPGSLGLFVAGGILIALGVKRRQIARARIG